MPCQIDGYVDAFLSAEFANFMVRQVSHLPELISRSFEFQAHGIVSVAVDGKAMDIKFRLRVTLDNRENELTHRVHPEIR